MHRIVLLFLLIALTPLRSWAGDAMAIQMARQSAVLNVALVGYEDTAHTDCHEQATGIADTPQATPVQEHCATCASCQACSTMALAFPVMQSAVQALPYSLPQALRVHFTSAVIAQGHKPPIS